MDIRVIRAVGIKVLALLCPLGISAIQADPVDVICLEFPEMDMRTVVVRAAAHTESCCHIFIQGLLDIHIPPGMVMGSKACGRDR